MLLYELHFVHYHNGEGKAERTAKEVASFTPLLISFCYQKSRWVRRKSPSMYFPCEGKAQPCCPVLLGTRCSSSSELSSGDAGSSPQPWGSTGCCSHESHQKQGKTTLPQPGQRQPQCRGSCCSRASLCLDAGSIPWLHRK